MEDENVTGKSDDIKKKPGSSFTGQMWIWSGKKCTVAMGRPHGQGRLHLKTSENN
jgi:hypothetical protein